MPGSLIKIVRSFDVVNVPQEEASEDEQEHFDEEEERKEKMKEVIGKLLVPHRPQIKLNGKFSHLGDKSVGAPKLTPGTKPHSGKKKRRDKSESSSKKEKKRRRLNS